MDNIKLAKFGGSSVADFESMDKSAEILLEQTTTRLVVLSASAGVTDLLLLLTKPQQTNHIDKILKKIQSIQFEILQQLPKDKILNAKISKLINNIEHLSKTAQLACSDALVDEILSHGELLSTLLFQAVLQRKWAHPVIWFDVRNVMYTDTLFGKVTPNQHKIKQLTTQHLQPLLYQHPNSIIITQGFIGRNHEHKTTTLGRGGSDYSATLLGEALQVARIDIWTDVTGIYTADPRYIQSAQPIKSLTFSEAAEMATLGAKILHPATLIPAIRNNIPIFIGSSKKPQEGGTIITQTAQNIPYFRAITSRSQQTLLTLHSLNILPAKNFLITILEILAKHHLAIELITASDVKIALIINSNSAVLSANTTLLTTSLQQELSALCKIEIEEQLALVAIIGNKLDTTTGVTQQIFDALTNMSIKMICSGTSNHNICILIKEKQLPITLHTLHQRLFGSCNSSGD